MLNHGFFANRVKTIWIGDSASGLFLDVVFSPIFAGSCELWQQSNKYQLLVLVSSDSKSSDTDAETLATWLRRSKRLLTEVSDGKVQGRFVAYSVEV